MLPVALALLSLHASEPVPPAAETIKLDIAAGPAFLQVPEALSGVRGWLPGVALDFDVVVPGAIAKAKAPKQAKRFIAKNGEVSIAPFWLCLLPQEAIIAPGDSLSVFGARWELFGLGMGTGIGPVSVGAHVGLPTVSVTRWSGPALDSLNGARWVANYGASLKGSITLKPCDYVHLEAGWNEQFGYQAGTVRSRLGEKADLWKQGTARFLLHIRIPVDLKI